jgi:AraC-like DNA-binding protein
LPNDALDARQGILFELDGGIAEYLKRIFEFMRDEKYPHTQTQKALILGFIVNKLFELCNESKITKVGESSFYIQSVIRHISENLSKTLNANDIAKRFSVSRSKLDRDFKSAVGMTLHDFEDICRLNYAKTLLRSDKKVSVAEISEACGLKNETYFYAFFKKYTGMSPTDYRKTFVSASGKSANEREIDFDPCGEI